jgi:hypothetical protein
VEGRPTLDPKEARMLVSIAPLVFLALIIVWVWEITGREKRRIENLSDDDLRSELHDLEVRLALICKLGDEGLRSNGRHFWRRRFHLIREMDRRQRQGLLVTLENL